jgi:AAA domain
MAGVPDEHAKAELSRVTAECGPEKLVLLVREALVARNLPTEMFTSVEDLQSFVDTQYKIEAELQAEQDHLIRRRRRAVRRVDAEEAEAARGERPIQTARQFAIQPKPAAVGWFGVGPNGIAGPSEAGKSLLARDRFLEIGNTKQNVLVVLSEGTHDFEERWTTQPLWETAADYVYVIDSTVNLVYGDDVDWLLKEYAQIRPVAVLFDVIYDMGMADDNGVKDVNPVISSMKRISAEWNAATVAVGHPGHNGTRRFRGSSMWRQLFVTEWHLADGALTCEKSKIADKRLLSASYQVDYPNLHWLSPMEAMVDEAKRQVLIREDIERHPHDSDSKRAIRLKNVIGLGERATRTRIAHVRKLLEVQEGGA